MKKSPIFLIILVILHALLLFRCSHKARQQSANHRIPVQTVAVQEKAITIPIQTSGKLGSKMEMKLSFKVGGIIEAINVDEGETVASGQILARLNLAEINAMANQARSALEKAQRDQARVQQLFKDRVATLEQLQNATTGLEMAQSNARIAEFNLQHAVIQAPAPGKILKRLAEANELIGPGVPVFLFGSTGQHWMVRAHVTDRDLVRLQPGDSARVSFDAYPQQSFPAKVTEIAEAADPFSGTYEVELQLRPVQARLVSGFVAQVEIYPARRQVYRFVPVEALVEGDRDRGFVYVITSDSGTVAKRPIQIDLITDGEIGVRKGLEGITHVITAGVAYLNEQSRVKEVNSIPTP
ncbi:efflux RND transporter periplasmic adaptor subunit [candidate division KSB1 bacterium]|nr:efflux RND transporter periplasmic adaptor subunit [candidate division KSB1 bacterium]